MHQLPKLPYAFDALEPHIDARTMEIHHDKHHQAYVDNLNKALEKAPELAGKSVEDLLRGFASVPEAIKGPVRNHGGGHANHSLFWEVMSPEGRREPSGDLAKTLEPLGGLAGVQEKLSAAAMGQFGSGSTPTTSSTRTAAPTTSRRGGTSSTGTRSPSVTRARAVDGAAAEGAGRSGGLC
jgi:Fe-Mn family superoxide dismutase